MSDFDFYCWLALAFCAVGYPYLLYPRWREWREWRAIKKQQRRYWDR